MNELRSESEIIKSWKTVEINPVVSICCATYNHKLYIEAAIKGFLMQTTSFPFEVLINDDASFDGTADIIKKYETLYPNIIKPLYQTENQYSKGNNKPHTTFNYPRAKGKYIAYCEGDDLWTDSSKLQLQISQLDSNPNIHLSIHSAVMQNQLSLERTIIGKYRKSTGLVPTEDIIEKKYGNIPTASTVIRASVLLKMVDFITKQNTTVGDIYIHFFAAHSGDGAIYINNPMSLYRFKTKGSWTNRFDKNREMQVSHIRNRIRSYEELNKITCNVYEISIHRSSYNCLKYFFRSNADFNCKLGLLNEFNKFFNIKQRILLFFWLCLHPFLPQIRALKRLLLFKLDANN